MSTANKKKFWKDHGSEKEIARENGEYSRDKQGLMKMRFYTKRDTFIKRRAQHNYITKEPMEDAKDIRGSRDPVYDVFRMETDIGIQAVRSLIESSTQTSYNRKVSACVQAEPEQVDVRLQPGKEEPTMDPKLKRFLGNVMPRMLHHLTQNKEVPIYRDDFVNLTEEDTFVGTREDNFLREAGNYTPHHTRKQHITSIDWRQGSKNIIAVSCIAPLSLQERIEQQRLVESSVALVWNLEDTMHPMYILESPNEILVIKFNPSRPNLVVGGCTNGQVVIWDLSRAPDASRGKQTTQRGRATHHQDHHVTDIPTMPKPIKGHSIENVGETPVSRLQPSQLSKVEMGHKRAIHDIAWVPDGLEFAFDGKMIPFAENKRPDGTTSTGPDQQFCTVSEDGYMHVWDLSPTYLPQDKLRKLKHQSKLGNEEPWVPVLKYQLQRPDGSGELLGLRLYLGGRVGGENSPASYHMCCSSIEGEFAICNIAPKDDKVQQPNFGDDGNKKEAKLIRTLANAHAGPVWSVQRHPQLPDYYLTCGDWGFKVWRVGLAAPIVSSPMGEQHVMCARWSPTRASVVFVGTRDGFINVWDLLDRSHEPVLVHPMIQDAITTLEFKPLAHGKTSALTQLIALGTKLGSFHLFGLPKVLVKGHSHELKNMSAFLERETRRVAYFGWRWKERVKEMDRQIQDKSDAANDPTKSASSAPKPAAASSGVLDDGDDKEDNDFVPSEEMERTFMEKVAALSAEQAEEDEDDE